VFMAVVALVTKTMSRGRAPINPANARAQAPALFIVTPKKLPGFGSIFRPQSCWISVLPSDMIERTVVKEHDTGRSGQ